MPSETEVFPYEIADVDKEENEELLEYMTGEKRGWLRVGPRGYCLPSWYRRDARVFYNFPVRQSDTWVVTFPRSGTTLTQEMVWVIANNFNFDAAFQTPLVERFPFLEYHLFMNEDIKEVFKQENEGDEAKKELLDKLATPGYDIIKERNEPRFIKTHLPLSLLPKDLLKSKVIYIARNPKDVAISYYHLLRLMRTSGYIGKFDKFWEYFERSMLPWSPYFEHVDEGWKIRHHPNVLFLFYEDMVKDMESTIKSVATFLNKPMTEKNLTDLTNHLAINNFRSNPSVNFDILKDLGVQAEGEQTFIRKGKSGSNESEFSEELNKRADKWMQENLSKVEWTIPNYP